MGNTPEVEKERRFQRTYLAYNVAVGHELVTQVKVHHVSRLLEAPRPHNVVRNDELQVDRILHQLIRKAEKAMVRIIIN